MIAAACACNAALSSAQEQPEASLLPEFGQVDFKAIDPDDPEQAQKDFDEGVPLYTDDRYLSLGSDGVLEMWNKAGMSAPVVFGFLQTEANSSALKLSQSLEVVRNLNIFVAMRDPSLEGTSAVELFPGVSGCDYSFDGSLNINYSSQGKQAVALRVGGEVTPVSASFNSALTVNGIFREENASLLYIAQNSSVKLNGQSAFIGRGEYPVYGIYLQNGSNLEVAGSLLIAADHVFAGAGSVNIDYSSAEPGTSVSILSGSLDNFSGTYSQKGGTLYLDGRINPENWNFEQVAMITKAENVLSVSVEDWDPVMSIQAALYADGSFSSLTLTDKEISVDYLDYARSAYSGIDLFVAGQLYVNGEILSNIRMEDYKRYFDSQADNGLILTSVWLKLEDNLSLDGEQIRIGGLKAEAPDSVLSLSNSSIELYGTSLDDVTTNLSWVSLGSGASMGIFGDSVSRNKDYTYATRVSASLYVSPQAQLSLGGLVILKGEVVNEGSTQVDSNSTLYFNGGYLQESGTTEFKPGSSSNFKSEIRINGGEFIAGGFLAADTLSQHGGSSVFSSQAYVGSFALGDGKSKEATVSAMNAGSEVFISQLAINQAGLTVGTVGDSLQAGGDGQRAWLSVNELEVSDGQIEVGLDGGLIYGFGDGETDGVKNLLTRHNLDALLAPHGLDGSALLVVNQSMDLSSVSSLSFGNAVSDFSNIRMGAGSVLVLSSLVSKPFFTDSQGTSEIAFEEGSTIFVLDPTKTVYLTDSSVTVKDGFTDVNIVSANSMAQVQLVDGGDGYRFELARDSVDQSKFLYPNIGNYLYFEYGDFSVDSENPGVQLFARADNVLYTNQSLKDTIVAEATQLSNLVGTKLTAYNSASRFMKLQSEELSKRDLLRPGELRLYGGLSYDLLYSKARNQYFPSAKFKAREASFGLGAVYALEDDLRIGVSAGVSKVRSDAKHSEVGADNDQESIAVGLGLVKDIGDFRIGLHAGYQNSRNDISAALPSGMQMGPLATKPRVHVVNAGVDFGWNVTDNIEVGARTTVWSLSTRKDKTSIGGTQAFMLDHGRQTFADLGLYAGVSAEKGLTSGAKLSFNGRTEGVLRAGQRREKSDLTLSGLAPVDRLNLSTFGRYNVGVGGGVALDSKGRQVALDLGVYTGDFKVSGAAMLKAKAVF